METTQHGVPKTRYWNRLVVQRPETSRGFIFDHCWTLPDQMLNDFQNLRAPFLAFNCGIHQKHHKHRRACQTNLSRICKESPRTNKSPPRTIQINDGTDTHSSIHPPQLAKQTTACGAPNEGVAVSTPHGVFNYRVPLALPFWGGALKK